MKLFSKISMMALAALAFAACSQEDFTNDVNPTPEQGEKTWAYFSFSFKESMTRAGVGNEDAQGNEAKINRAAIYIFKADGSFEVKADGEANNNHIPSVAVEVTSGVKTIVAVLNDNQKDDRATTGTTLNAFLAQVETAKTTTLYNADTDGIVDMLMTGQKIATLLPNVSQEDAESNSNTSNHVQLSVDRVAAKLDVTSTKLNVGTLGNLKGLSYNVLNLHKTPYTVLQTVDAKGVIPTPFYAETVSDIYAGYYSKNTNEDLTT